MAPAADIAARFGHPLVTALGDERLPPAAEHHPACNEGGEQREHQKGRLAVPSRER